MMMHGWWEWIYLWWEMTRDRTMARLYHSLYVRPIQIYNKRQSEPGMTERHLSWRCRMLWLRRRSAGVLVGEWCDNGQVETMQKAALKKYVHTTMDSPFCIVRRGLSRTGRSGQVKWSGAARKWWRKDATIAERMNNRVDSHVIVQMIHSVLPDWLHKVYK